MCMTLVCCLLFHDNHQNSKVVKRCAGTSCKKNDVKLSEFSEMLNSKIISQRRQKSK